MHADPSDVDAAVIARLQNDPELALLMPNGVYWDVAADGATQFVLVSSIAHEDTYTLPGTVLWERFTYLVKAVMRGSSGNPVKEAAARIHDVMQDVPLTPTGYYRTMAINRVRRVRFTEFDSTTNERWQHRGGHYEVWICPRT
jgi:hypothetical protein